VNEGIKLSTVSDFFELQLAMGVEIHPNVAKAIREIMGMQVPDLWESIGCQICSIVSDESETWVIIKESQPFGVEVIEIICFAGDGIHTAKLFPIGGDEFFDYGKLQCKGPTLIDLTIALRQGVGGLIAFLEQKMGKQK